MARLKSGPWGALIGKLGNNVGYIRKGVAILRMRSHPSTKKRSAGQNATVQRFKLMIKFIATMNDFTNIGFGIAARKVSPTAQNLAVSYNTKNAVKGVYPDQEIDYAKVMVSQGVIPLPANINAVVEDLAGKIKITFSWDVDPNTPSARKRDQVMMLAYLPEVKQSFYLDSGARRMEGQDELKFLRNQNSVNHPNLVTHAEVYIAFVANDRNSVSDSYYCGRLDF